MPTERQIAANRGNAGKSTGPRTLQGKAISRMNAVKHGLTRQLASLPQVEREAFHRFRLEIVAAFPERTTKEVLLINEVALAAWRIASKPLSLVTEIRPLNRKIGFVFSFGKIAA